MLPIVYHTIYSQLDLPPEHRYPISKYRRLYGIYLKPLMSVIYND